MGGFGVRGFGWGVISVTVTFPVRVGGGDLGGISVSVKTRVKLVKKRLCFQKHFPSRLTEDFSDTLHQHGGTCPVQMNSCRQPQVIV